MRWNDEDHSSVYCEIVVNEALIKQVTDESMVSILVAGAILNLPLYISLSSRWLKFVGGSTLYILLSVIGNKSSCFLLYQRLEINLYGSSIKYTSSQNFNPQIHTYEIESLWPNRPQTYPEGWSGPGNILGHCHGDLSIWLTVLVDLVFKVIQVRFQLMHTFAVQAAGVYTCSLE